MQFLGLEIVAREKRNTESGFSDAFWQSAVTTTSSGAIVSPTTATRVAAVYACVRLLSETIASLPLILYRRIGNDAKERATDHPLYRILSREPNQVNTRFEFIETLMWHLLLRGNAYCEVTNGTATAVGYLTIRHPDQVTLEVRNDRIIYKYRDEQGRTRIIPSENMVHIRGHSDDGLVGKGPIQVAREAIGTAMSVDEYNSRIFANGVQLTGVLEHPAQLDDPTAKRISESFSSAYAGASKAGKVAVLEEGMKFNPISMTNHDAQFIEMRKFGVTEIARIFRVPPHMIGDLERATFSNIEHQGMDFKTYSIQPNTVRIEQALERTLLGETDAETYFIEFLVDGLLRGDLQSRYTAYQTGVQTGFLKLNEVRAKENLNPLDWGDISLIPLNMKAVGSKEDLENEPAEDVTEEDEPVEEEAPAEDAPGEVPADSEDARSIDDYTYSLRRMFNTFRRMAESAFEKLLSREVNSLVRTYRTQQEWDEKLRQFLRAHHANVHNALAPVVVGLVENLETLANIFKRTIGSLSEETFDSIVNEYIGRRFDELWALPFENLAAGIKATATSRMKEEVERLEARLAEELLGKEGYGTIIGKANDNK